MQDNGVHHIVRIMIYLQLPYWKYFEYQARQRHFLQPVLQPVIQTRRWS